MTALPIILARFIQTSAVLINRNKIKLLLYSVKIIKEKARSLDKLYSSYLGVFLRCKYLIFFIMINEIKFLLYMLSLIDWFCEYNVARYITKMSLTMTKNSEGHKHI